MSTGCKLVSFRNIQFVTRHLKNGLARAVIRTAPSTYDLVAGLMLRRIYGKSGVIFVHVPKNAGTSVASVLYGRGVGHFRASMLKRAFPDLWDELPKIAVTRDPWERLYSAYRYAKHGGGSDGIISEPWRYRSSEFRTFDSFIVEWLQFQNVDELDPVFRSQVHYIDERMDYVVSAGEVQTICGWLRSRGLRVGEIPRLNSSKQETVTQLSTEAMDIVFKKYARDFSEFGYSAAAPKFFVRNQ